jgi:hypothetical protein
LGGGLALAAPTPTPTPAPLTFVQGTYATPQSPLTSVTLPFGAAQKAGDLNAVIVGWNDATTHLSSLTDSKGNLYQLAVGPTVLKGSVPLTQAIYYAKNIAAAVAGANTVTLKFNAAAVYVDVRILEYSGVDPLSPLDVSATATGNSATSSSGAVLTKNAKDLLVGANLVWTGTTTPRAGWTRRMITNPDSDIAEDQVVSSVGSYSASASLASAGPWIMQMVAFRAVGSAPKKSVSLAWNADSATNNPNTNAVGYRLHTGFSSGNYTQSTDLGKTTAVTLPLQQSGATYFMITAYNSAGIESPASNQISATAP